MYWIHFSFVTKFQNIKISKPSILSEINKYIVYKYLVYDDYFW